MATIFGLLKITDRKQAGCMTLKEYHLRLKGYALKRLDNERDIYLQAYLNNIVKATDRSGKPKFPKFEDFYDYDKRREDILGRSTPKMFDSVLLERVERVKKLKKRGDLNG